MANKRAVLKFYKGGLNSTDIEDMPWYEWHEIVKDLSEHIKREEAESKKNGNNKGGDSYAEAKRMMKNSTPNMKMPNIPKLK